METLIILLVVLITGGAATIGTLALVVLGSIYLNTRPKKEDDEDNQLFTLPIASAGGVGGRIITPEDIEKAKIAYQNYQNYQASQVGGTGGCGDGNKEEFVPNEGGYI